MHKAEGLRVQKTLNGEITNNKTPVSFCIRMPKAIVGFSYFSDEYDFEYRSQEAEPDFFKRTVNNDCGYALQENGYGTVYWINVIFPFYIPTE